MTDHIKYWVPVLILATGYAGIALGDNWVWLGLATFPVMAILDSLLPLDYGQRSIRSAGFVNLSVWIGAVGPVLLYPFLAWRMTVEPLTTVQLVGAALSCAWMGVIPLIPAAHELYHMRSQFARTVGRYAHLCILDCTRDIGHVVGHHIDVATTEDTDTARRGQDLYSFSARSVVETTRYALRMEAEALKKKGLSPWHLQHRVYRALLALLIFEVILFLIGGWLAVLVCTAGMLVSRFWVESFNYFQHYGLIRLPGAPIGKRHVWNHLRWLSRTSTYEITNHADHHLNSYQPFYQLVPHQQSIPMPSVFVCFLTALIPPVWHRMVIMPALKRWDREYANAEERKLAAEANRAAGWPDWLNENPAEVGRAATVGI